MKNLIIAAIIALSGSACAHHDTNVEHHHHEEAQASFDGYCAYSVAQNNFGILGKKDYSFEHAGMTYYFSSEEKMKTFKKDLDKNLKSANEHWESRAGRN